MSDQLNNEQKQEIIRLFNGPYYLNTSQIAKRLGLFREYVQNYLFGQEPVDMAVVTSDEILDTVDNVPSGIVI